MKTRISWCGIRKDFIAISADRPRTTLPRVTEEQPVCQLIRFLSPDREPWLWWRPAIWRPDGFCHRDIFIQVGQYLFDDHRIFNAGDDVHGAAAFMAGFNIDVEHLLEPLCPSLAA